MQQRIAIVIVAWHAYSENHTAVALSRVTLNSMPLMRKCRRYEDPNRAQRRGWLLPASPPATLRESTSCQRGLVASTWACCATTSWSSACRGTCCARVGRLRYLTRNKFGWGATSPHWLANLDGGRVATWPGCNKSAGVERIGQYRGRLIPPYQQVRGRGTN